MRSRHSFQHFSCLICLWIDQLCIWPTNRPTTSVCIIPLSATVWTLLGFSVYDYGFYFWLSAFLDCFLITELVLVTYDLDSLCTCSLGTLPYWLWASLPVTFLFGPVWPLLIWPAWSLINKCIGLLSISLVLQPDIWLTKGFYMLVTIPNFYALMKQEVMEWHNIALLDWD